MPALFPHSPQQKEQRNIWENLIKAKYFLLEKETSRFWLVILGNVLSHRSDNWKVHAGYYQSTFWWVEMKSGGKLII